MELDALKQTIKELETQLNSIKTAVSTIESCVSEKATAVNQETIRQRCIQRANIMRKAMFYYEQGCNSWQVAEHIQDYFGSVWDAYYFITSQHGQDLARKRYARAYLIKALSDAGFTLKEPSKIAGITPQGCSKLLKRKSA